MSDEYAHKASSEAAGGTKLIRITFGNNRDFAKQSFRFIAKA
jgi:hypothetical protein